MLSSIEKGAGHKPTLVLHGFLGSARNLSSLSQRLSERLPDRRFFCADLPGHGDSPALDAQRAFLSLVRPTLDYVEHLATEFGEPVDIIGHSMGGRVGLVVAAEHRELVDRICLLDIAPGPVGDRNKDLEAIALALLAAPERAHSRDEMRGVFLAHGVSPALANWLLMNLRDDGSADPHGRLVWRFDRQALVDLGKNTRGDDLWPAAERVGARACLFYGDRSGFVTPDDVARMRALGARVEALAGAGHFVHIDAFDDLVEHLVSLLT